MNKETKQIYNSYVSIEAKQSIDYIDGICEKCFKNGLLGKPYPSKNVVEIIKVIAEEFDFLKQCKKDD